MPYQAIINIILIFGAAIAVIVVSKKLKMAPAIGFILTGLIWSAVAPTALKSNDELKLLSEFGIVFLLFMVGLEFSPSKVGRLVRAMFVGGSVQAILTIGVTLGFALMGLISFVQAILFGFIIIQSSTAIALKIYQDRGEIDSPHAETSIGISLFQDISTVLLLILIPFLGANLTAAGNSAFIVAGRGFLILAACAAIAYYFLPVILRWVVLTGIRELVVLLALFFCLGFATLSQALGFSMALGAFMCGLLLNRSEYHPQIIAETASFRDVFLSLFFISIGLGYNWQFAVEHFLPVVLLTVAVMSAKTVILFISTRLVGFPFRTSLLAGVGISNIGEFGFIIMIAALPYGLITDYQYQMLGNAAIYSMLLTPFLIVGISKLTLRFGAKSLTEKKRGDTFKTRPKDCHSWLRAGRTASFSSAQVFRNSLQNHRS